MARAKWKTCATPGCPTLVETGKCGPCRAEDDAARPTPAARGYDANHRRLRAELAPFVEAGGVSCWRCGKRIVPGAVWHLGHDDDDRRITRGPEHADCNLAAAARKGNRSRAGRL